MALLRMGEIEGTNGEVGAMLLVRKGDKLTVSDCDVKNRPAFVSEESNSEHFGKMFTIQFEDFKNGSPNNKGCFSRCYSVQMLIEGILDGTIEDRE